MLNIIKHTVSGVEYHITRQTEIYVLCLEDTDEIILPVTDATQPGGIGTKKVLISKIKPVIRSKILAMLNEYNENYLKEHIITKANYG